MVIDEQHGRDDERAHGVTTGSGVTEVLAPLASLERLPLGEHVAVFEDVHAGLQRLLSESER